jgi:hypothetical protein
MFLVSKKVIEDNYYDFRINNYREIKNKDEEFEESNIIIERVLEREKQIIELLKGIKKNG